MDALEPILMRFIDRGSSEAMQAWQRLGFTSFETVETQRLPLDQFEPRLAPLVERMQGQGRIPEGAPLIGRVGRLDG